MHFHGNKVLKQFVERVRELFMVFLPLSKSPFAFFYCLSWPCSVLLDFDCSSCCDCAISQYVYQFQTLHQQAQFYHGFPAWWEVHLRSSALSWNFLGCMLSFVRRHGWLSVMLNFEILEILIYSWLIVWHRRLFCLIYGLICLICDQMRPTVYFRRACLPTL